MILSLMLLNYDMLLQYIILTLSIMIHFRMLHSWPNLSDLTFKRDQSDFCIQLFLLKIDNRRAIYVYFMTCSVNINEFRQVFYLFNNPSFFHKFFDKVFSCPNPFGGIWA